MSSPFRENYRTADSETGDADKTKASTFWAPHRRSPTFGSRSTLTHHSIPFVSGFPHSGSLLLNLPGPGGSARCSRASGHLSHRRPAAPKAAGFSQLLLPSSRPLRSQLLISPPRVLASPQSTLCAPPNPSTEGSLAPASWATATWELVPTYWHHQTMLLDAAKLQPSTHCP